jgi:hypothetical protein
MSKTVSLDLLRSLDVASPCSADWESMTGDDCVRHCASCDLNVYNLSAMTADEAAELVSSKEGRLCARFYRRADGTVLTQDCPVGLRLLRAKARRTAHRIGAATAFLLCAGLGAGAREGRTARLASIPPFSLIRQWLSPVPPPRPPLMGKPVVMGVAAPRHPVVPPASNPPGAPKP